MKCDLNQLYKDWYAASPENKEPFRDKLGEDLYYYISRVIRREFSGWREYLEDGIGEASHEVFRSLSTYVPAKGDFKQWVYGVTVYTCRDMLRQRGRRNEIHMFGHEDAIDYKDYEAKLLLSDIKRELTNDERELINLKLEGLSNSDIAEEQHTTEGYVEVKWGRLCQKIRTLGVDNA